MAKKKDDLITLSQAAETYGYSGDYLRRLAENGRLRARKFGRNWLTTSDDVETFIESREQRGVYKKNPRTPRKKK
ncbi:MAG: helix-turn-helix domain-containing protein [Gammaproteobacteria bacterium]|nr:helix-turn-helix domain-containing protein [Gammaproteobacteria bacterium]